MIFPNKALAVSDSTCFACMLGYFLCFLMSADFFQNQLFPKIFLLGLLTMSQTVSLQIRHDKMSGLIWVQAVRKGHQQTTQADKRVNLLTHSNYGICQLMKLSKVPKLHIVAICHICMMC